MPPNFNDLPEPGKKETTDQNNNETFEEKILNNALKDNNEKEKTITKSTEELILKNIKKNDSN